jgi:hypothetical protein
MSLNAASLKTDVSAGRTPFSFLLMLRVSFMVLCLPNQARLPTPMGEQISERNRLPNPRGSLSGHISKCREYRLAA